MAALTNYLGWFLCFVSPLLIVPWELCSVSQTHQPRAVSPPGTVEDAHTIICPGFKVLKCTEMWVFCVNRALETTKVRGNARQGKHKAFFVGFVFPEWLIMINTQGARTHQTSFNSVLNNPLHQAITHRDSVYTAKNRCKTHRQELQTALSFCLHSVHKQQSGSGRVLCVPHCTAHT